MGRLVRSSGTNGRCVKGIRYPCCCSISWLRPYPSSCQKLGGGALCGVVTHLIPGGISHLQYVDGTIIMVQDDDEQIANLKFIPMCFEDM
jgi:hypothetical protein